MPRLSRPLTGLVVRKREITTAVPKLCSTTGLYGDSRCRPRLCRILDINMSPSLSHTRARMRASAFFFKQNILPAPSSSYVVSGDVRIRFYHFVLLSTLWITTFYAAFFFTSPPHRTFSWQTEITDPYNQHKTMIKKKTATQKQTKQYKNTKTETNVTFFGSMLNFLRPIETCLALGSGLLQKNKKQLVIIL